MNNCFYKNLSKLASMNQSEIKVHVITLAVWQLIWSGTASYATSDDAIVSAISAAKIMAPGYKVGATNYPGNHEVIVSTYANVSSKDVLNDCKIDALLIAKRVLEIEPQTVRVKVRFYTANQESYKQVVVTKPEIAAFSQGSVKKDELLMSLEVTTAASGLQPVTSKKAATRLATTSGSTGSGTSGIDSAGADGLSSFNLQSLKFSASKSWKVKEMKNEYGDFLELWRDRTAWHSIIFRLQDRDSPAAVVDEDDRLYWSLHNHRITGRSEMMIGRQKNIRALVVYVKDDENPKEPDRHETHVYFGNPHRVYSLSVRYCGADAAAVTSDLNTILSSIVD